MATTLTVTKVSLIVPVTVVCTGERREISRDDIVPGNTHQRLVKIDVAL